MHTNEKNITICVGAAKAGTSWLYKCLEEHPHIAAARGKETNFFLNPNSDCSDFFSYFEPTKETKIYFESSPKYFSEPAALKRICECYPQAKIIILLRDPAARTISHINHMVGLGKYNHSANLSDIEQITPEVFKQSQYEQYVPITQEIFGSKNVLILDYARIAEEPQSLIDEVCKFLNLPPFTPSFLKVKYNSAKARSHPHYLKIKSLYIKSRRYKVTRALTSFLRSIGINSGTLEKVLARTNRSKSTTRPTHNIEKNVATATTYYHQQFKR